MKQPLPVTGAWRPGDPVGNRQFVTFATDRAFALEGGGTLCDVTLAYETWGRLNDTGSNALLINHAWTGDSHAIGPNSIGHATSGWWDGVIGPGCTIDTDQWFVVCVNVLGGCQGSTGPASPHPDDGQPYGSRFPVVTVRDMVRAQARLADHLGVDRWASVIGGSMGGMQSLEWAVTFPDRVGSLISIASCMASSPQQIAWGAVGRQAIALDPKWRGGNYYDAEPGDGPHEGLMVARQVAQITFRTDGVFSDKFGRDLVDKSPGFHLWQQFEVERYLDHHGEKLVRRFDANSYLWLTKAMDLHDIGRGRGGMQAALARIKCDVLSIGVDTDILYPAYQSRELVDRLSAMDRVASYCEIESPHGHDAFLIDLDQLDVFVRPWLDKQGNAGAAKRRA
jgi:homoserine O-acetyltransferase/O-succinyltransferase